MRHFFIININNKHCLILYHICYIIIYNYFYINFLNFLFREDNGVLPELWRSYS